MKNSRDGKSYSTNLAYTPPEYLRTGFHRLQDFKFASFEDCVLFAGTDYLHCLRMYSVGCHMMASELSVR